MNVFSGLLHTHLLGRRIKLRQIRGGVELPPLFQDDNYDFNYQVLRPGTLACLSSWFCIESFLISSWRPFPDA